MNLCNVKEVNEIMTRHGLHFQKKFGQNFLVNKAVVEDIADGACDDAHRTVLEIGPGIGTLTRELCAVYDKVIALEIDADLIPVLGETLAEFGNVTVKNEDVMKCDLKELLKEDFEKGKVSVCGNLPYYITSPILMKLLESRLPFDTVTVMVQKEVADRLCAKAGSKDYGAITAAVNYYASARRLFNVPAGDFMPAPKVDSAVVRLDLYREKPFVPKEEALFFKTVKYAFAMRRKTLENALAGGFTGVYTKEQVAEAIARSGLRADIRGERLSTGEFVRLSDILFEMKE